ncbi:unnamed protein product [Zymoseptoria tritici ST99CH_3D1]|nr:unnamed protein product [Zymoseptoria tritici ST99CH_3D1]
MKFIKLSVLAIVGLVLLPVTPAILKGTRVEVPPNRTPNLLLRDLPEGTCNDATPCPNKACCGSNGLCGYSPLECGSGCASNCDAKAECGEYAASGKQNCPLSVCCSKFGFCGSTNLFCRDGCQKDYGSCGDAPKPSCSDTLVGKRTVGYYESWANSRDCQTVAPEDLDLSGYSSVNFAFAYFDPVSFEVLPMDASSAELYRRFTALKEKSPGLQTWISIGGWTFNDPGPTRNAFSTMASSSSNRRKFLKSILNFMNTYGFDGVDLDWEYPQAEDRGGKPEDSENLVLLAQQLQRSLKAQKKGLTLTIPASYWYLRHFDVKSLQDHVDWFNLMSYDLHGTWDKEKLLATHTNLTEIETALDLLWRAGVDPTKVVLGQAHYGRSFKLKDSSCITPNGKCLFEGDADPGPCSNASGILNYQEIQDIISDEELEPIFDKRSATKWISWIPDQWVSFDDDDTLLLKKDFAIRNCLGGFMVWAMDQKQPPLPVSKDQDETEFFEDTFGFMSEQAEIAGRLFHDQGAKLGCLITECDMRCFPGTSPVALMRGQPGQLPLSDKCEKKEYRSLCCFDGSNMGKCQWNGFQGQGQACIGGCPKGQIELATDSNVFNGKKDQPCEGGFQSFCCESFEPTPDLIELLPMAAEFVGEQLKAAAIAKAAEASADQAAKAICKVGVSVATNIAKRIPIIGQIVSAIGKLFKKGIENACSDVMSSFFDPKHATDIVDVFRGGKKPPKTVTNPPQTRPPVNPQRPLSTQVCSSDKMAGGKNCRRGGPVKYIQTAEETTYPAPDHKDCNPLWTQACYNYASVMNHKPEYKTLLCPTTKSDARARRLTRDIWYKQHHAYWRVGWMQQFGADCEADEVPGAAWWQEESRPQFIRFLPRADNGAAGSLWNLKICSFVDYGLGSELPYSRASERVDGVTLDGGVLRSVTKYKGVTTQHALVIDFPGGAPPGDWGHQDNPCWPKNLVNDPGFALLTWDPYYLAHKPESRFAAKYKNAIPKDILQAANNKCFSSSEGYKKRDDKHPLDPEAWIFNDGNSTRLLTNDELEDIGILKCASADCQAEMQDLGIESAAIMQQTEATVLTATPSAFATAVGTAEATGTSASPGSLGSTSPAQTAAVQ